MKLLKCGTNLLLNLSSPRDYVVRSSHFVLPSVTSFVRSFAPVYVLDRQLLNGSSHRHKNRRLCSRPHSYESVIFSNFWDSYFSSYGEFGQGRSKRSGWSGHGRTNNRAGKFHLIFLHFFIFLAGIIIEPGFFSRYYF